ncbi:hypothetical protein FB45DRAFT_1052271 [Roridomyces roridus]|uniref:Sld7 C-terminal domain-containing protein n=1 Tax=Roridomyces roridus TaxID=1738132 RepID=A0AAD7CGB5_9AGAR|nr:hypothetical protein FB45DRAFT_1052271 [Roridomyces roridus]
MSKSQPNINIIQPTPPRASPFRLLYRGALSLPDSHLLLDGLTFSARLDTTSPGHKLLDNPLALALESMRGRPSLRWIGLTKLSDIYTDETGGITMDVHPSATLSRIYFENTFCLDPSSSSQSGIKVALGDSDGPETTHMVIFARPQGIELQLVVARITPAPLPTAPRLPRPDDPTPRRPPLRFDRSASLGGGTMFAKKRSASTLANLGSGVRLGVESSGSFKVPEMPIARSAKGKEREIIPIEEDVFGEGAVVENKGKRKRTEDWEVESQMEKANKTIIKQSALHAMGIPKTHPEYKDVYGAVYRGVGFAMRAEMKKSAVDLKQVERLVKLHWSMYAPVDARPSKGQSKP